MNHDNSGAVDVVDALRGSLGDVTMHATADDIVTAGRTRRRHHRVAGLAAGVAVAAGLGVAVAYGGAPAKPPATAETTQAGVHIQTVAFTVDTRSDGTVHVTWDKQRYFEDRAGLEAALRKAGMPVVIRVGEFCAGPHDDTTLDPSGSGPGVDQVIKAETEAVGAATGDRAQRVSFVFTPSAMPAGKQLFIGYLNASQLAVTHGRPGSVERLVSVGVPLTCTTTPPPAHR
jgi:hypothetical protein